MANAEKAIKEAIINTGKKIYALRLVAAHSGNLSAKLNQDNILITATGTSLGSLKENDIIKVDLKKSQDINKERLSSEFPLHSLIYKNFPAKVVIHCHPPLINGYFAVSSDIKALTFETRLYLGNVPVVTQDTPAITKPELVIEALKNNNLAVIKNHGVVSIGQEFNQALDLIEMLEEAVKVAAVARIFKKEALDEMDEALKENLSQSNAVYPMFSKEHIQAIVDLVNKDEFIAKKGQELDLTLKLAIQLDETNQAYKFNFEKGKIVRLDTDSDAPFIISAPGQVWEQVFLGKLDSFVAVTQGKMKLQGQLGQLSKWYVPFSRLFELFKQVKFK
jgi:L-fuculose-phosphate aldolase